MFRLGGTHLTLGLIEQGVPVIDMSLPEAVVANAVSAACRSSGFFYGAATCLVRVSALCT